MNFKRTNTRLKTPANRKLRGRIGDDGNRAEFVEEFGHGAKGFVAVYRTDADKQAWLAGGKLAHQ
jgi:hypothetical protein